VTTLAVPTTPWTGKGPRPLVSYQFAIDGLGGQCTPSYQLQQGNSSEEATAAGAFAKGWAVNIPDHEGQDMEYGAGNNAAHIILDSIRAIYNVKGEVGASNPLGMIGYSGGGQATTWAVEQQPSYAPELHIVASAPGGIPVDLKEVAKYNDGGPGFGLVLAASEGVARGYPELATALETMLNAEGKAAEQKVSKECLSEYVGQYPNRKFSEFMKPEYAEPLSVPQVENVLKADSLPKGIPTAPTFLWQSAADEIIPVAGVDRLADDYCSEGVNVTYDRGASGDHVTYTDNAPAAIAYLEAHFNGESVASTCGVNASADTRIGSGPSGATEAGSATFTYAAAPAVEGTTFECKFDTAEFATCPSGGSTYTSLAAGQHAFAVRSVTATGHRDVSPATRSWYVTGAELGVSVSATPNPVSVKKRLTYTVTVENTGPEAARNVVVSNTLAGSLRVRSAASSQGGCALRKRSTSFVCGLSQLEAGARATVTIVVTPNETGTLSETASVTDGGPPDRNPANNTATQTTTVTPRR
jgi:uncharacterized repeat protein (TIGR01451 family)